MLKRIRRSIGGGGVKPRRRKSLGVVSLAPLVRIYYVDAGGRIVCRLSFNEESVKGVWEKRVSCGGSSEV